MTLEEILNRAAAEMEGAGCYFGHGTDNAWDEAVAMARAVCHLPRNATRDELCRTLTLAEINDFENLLKKRTEKRIPLPYLTHSVYFGPFEFYVDDRVQIPRTPILECLQNQCSPWIDPTSVTRILDLCCGSGCIGLTSTAYFPETTIILSDIDAGACAVTQKNIERLQLQQQASVVQSDLFEQISGQFDIIFSNPPYVGTAEMATLPKEYGYEPNISLTAGENGLALVEKILQRVKPYLKPNGILICEVGNSKDVLIEARPDLPFIWLTFESDADGVFLLSRADL